MRRKHRGASPTRAHRLLRGVARLEPWLILALVPFLTFPQPDWTPWLLALVPLMWCCRWFAWGRLTVRTPLDGPLLGMLVMVLVSLWATFNLLTSFHELCGVILGVALFYALVNALHTERGVWMATGLLLAGGVAVAGVGLVGAHWPTGKIPLLLSFLAPIYRELPPLVRGLPRAESGLNANQVGGTLTLFIPLTATLLLFQLRRRRPPPVPRTVSSAGGSSRRGWSWALSMLGATGALVLEIFVLILTQSRLSYLAATLGLLLVGASQGRWLRLVTVIVLLLTIGWVVYYGPETAGHALFGIQGLEPSSDPSWEGRVELWKRAVRVIQDHPFTGVGFGAISRVVHARYPTFLLAAGSNFVHVHNLFLEVGLDLGLPGLAAFLWLLIALGRMSWQVWRDAVSPAYQALAAGLSLGLLSHLFFGLADAAHLGAKSGIFLWAYLGLGAALWVNAETRAGHGQIPSRFDHRAV